MKQEGISFLMEHKQHALKSVSKLKQHALKGQKLLAQGIALGNNDSKRVALKGQKLSNTGKTFKAFAPSGRISDCNNTQGDALG